VLSCVARQNEYSTAAIRAPVGVRDDTPAAPSLKLILDPIVEADFCNGSYGCGRTAQEAVARVDQDIVEGKIRVIDVDLAAYCDTVRHDLLLGQVVRRVRDGEILHLLELMRSRNARTTRDLPIPGSPLSTTT
jgi:hypothetical protein